MARSLQLSLMGWLGALMLTTTSFAGEIVEEKSGEAFPDLVEVELDEGSAQMRATGTALRKKFFFKIYAAVGYVDESVELGDDPGREVLTGETYAIVVEFISRATTNDTNPIAYVLGMSGAIADPYAGGSGAEDTGTGYALDPTMDDYIFRTFVLE